MEIEIGNSKLKLVEEEYVKVSHPRRDHRLRLFYIAEENLNGNDLLQKIYDRFNKDEFNQTFWLIKFHLAFPLNQYKRKFYFRSFDELDELEEAFKIKRYYDSYREKKYFRTKDKFRLLFRLGGKDVVEKREVELFLNSTFEEEPYINEGCNFFRDWNDFNSYLLNTVFIEFRQLYLDTPKNRRIHIFKKFGEEKQEENPGYFKRSQILGEWIWNDFVNKYHKLIYRKIRNDLNLWEKRLFLLMYTRKDFLHDRIPIYEPRILEFAYLSSDIFNLCLALFVYKIRSIGTINVEEMLIKLYKAFLASFPIWHFIWRDHEKEKKYEKKWQEKRLVSISTTIAKTDNGDDITIEDRLSGSDDNLLRKFTFFLEQYITKEEADIFEKILAGNSQEEIAKELGCSQEMISKKWKKIIEKLRRKIKQEDLMHLALEVKGIENKRMQIEKTLKRMFSRNQENPLKYWHDNKGSRSL